MSDVNLSCPHCGQSLEIPEELFGQTVPCPSCQQEIELVKPAPPPLPVISVANPLPLAPPQTKICLFCGERIMLAAKKCKHCGELLDKAPAPVQTQVPAAARQNIARCPKCGCTSIAGAKQGFGAGMGCIGTLLFGWIGLLCGACGGNRMYSHCLQCGHKWKLN